ncbi:MAG: restriction endonuclease subunit S [Sedimenticola sp.]
MWHELGKVAQVGSGYPFRGKVESDPNGTLVILQQKDISDLVAMGPEQLAEVVPDGAARASEADTYERHRLMSGDVLLQMRGGQFLSVVFAGNYPAIAALGVAVIRPDTKLMPQFLCWFLGHPRTTEKLRSMAGGTHIPFLSKKTLTGYRVPVPSLETQQRVVKAHDIRRRHRAATQRLIELNDELVDAITWQAAIQEQ